VCFSDLDSLPNLLLVLPTLLLVLKDQTKLVDAQDVCFPDLDSLQSEADNKRSIAESCAKMALDVVRMLAYADEC
jgi:hypothetical protein